MKILVKNKLGKDKKITLINGDDYLLKNGDQKVIGDYLDTDGSVYKLLVDGFIVSLIADEDIKSEMLII